ncbi:prostaglandin-endoperoxide synthase 2 [Mycolicibacterium iranicum]|uniref:Prostaglandin-endoperoxide synthase 2 n=1 Tax=Mycolicibacterium iranicum TaxID=912594 RepID=A0A839Q8W7_MYCIR|nr:peroxidase family protein [Mycolicibacterium iranicum]MBB2992628.1 prostaglandin-endoperoxide synthase 2 [Mycolicibacterium iranicum]
MTGGFWRTYGVRNGVRIVATTRSAAVWLLLRRLPVIRSAVNRWMINSAVYTMKTRPGALSTMGDYTSWESLRDRTYNRRYLGRDPALVGAGSPTSAAVTELFRRPAGRTLTSEKSTLLFPLFAQWFVDGFLRTDPTNPLKNTSTHDIDLSQLYGQTRDVTRMLRSGVGGRLRSQQIGGREFPCHLFGDDGVRDEFAELPTVYRGADVKARAIEDVGDDLRPHLFALGIPRGNIHYGFAMMSTLFLREHNRVAALVAAELGSGDDDRIFETTRNAMIVLLIKIVIEDYINHITPIRFPLFVEPGIGVDERWHRQNWMSTEFNLLYRWHTLIPTEVTVGGQRRAFHSLEWDTRPVTSHGLAALFDEASRQPCSTISLLNTADWLLPLETKSIDTARAAQLASFNAYRKACGYPALRGFGDLSSDGDVRKALEDCYGSIDEVELYPGLFAEDVRAGATLPPLMTTMVAVDAFSQALTNPLLDPNLYTADTFSKAGLATIDATKTLGDVVRRNLGGESLVPTVSLAL